MLNRRSFLVVAALGLRAFLNAASKRMSAFPAALAKLEKSNQARIGVAVLDTATGERSGYRADERFPMCSTFKFLLVAAVLQRVDRHQAKLDWQIAIPPKPLIGNSPLTLPHAGGAMTVAGLCEAAIIRSDNTAANLLLETIGGPAGLTSFCRSIGDTVTRLDRTEPSLNESRPGDQRDTTSPAAMADDLNRVLLGDVLTAAPRKQIASWMEGNQTGLDKLRASLPAGWRAADKTGNNGENTMNDIAVISPAGKKPIVVAAYITRCDGPDSKRVAMLKEIGELVMDI
jgi:beta-lactamase class A